MLSLLHVNCVGMGQGQDFWRLILVNLYQNRENTHASVTVILLVTVADTGYVPLDPSYCSQAIGTTLSIFVQSGKRLEFYISLG